MSQYDKWKTQHPERTPRAQRFQAGSGEPSPLESAKYRSRIQENDDEQPLGARINTDAAIRELGEYLAHLPPSQQSLTMAGMAAAISHLCPWHLQRFFSEIKDNPIAADTADRSNESMRFMQHGTERD